MGGKRLGGHNRHTFLLHVSWNVFTSREHPTLLGTMHTFVSKYGLHPSLLFLTQPEATAMVPLHGSSDLVTVPLRSEPLCVDHIIFWLQSSML